MNSKELAEKVILETESQLLIWHKYDHFLLAFLNRISEKMFDANERLLSTIQEGFSRKGSIDVLTSEICKILRQKIEEGSINGIEQVQKILTDKGVLDSDLKTLLGIVHYNVLLHKRLKNFQVIAETIANLTHEKLEPAVAKRLLLKYGPGLSLVWRDCEAHCKSNFELEILKKVNVRQKNAKVPSAPEQANLKKVS